MTQQLYFGPYLLVRKLGVGGMAQVWLAKRAGPGGFERVLVLKRILPTLSQDPRFVKMFIAEARLAALLNHRNIVQVFELGEISGEHYLAMEFIDGVDARTYMMSCLRKDETPDVGFAVFVMREVCTALGYAHGFTDGTGKRLKLIHRDVTPANIMMARDGAVKLVDFGIAKALSDASGSTTQVGQFKGKLGYLAPEQVMLKKLDHRVDIFGAGIVLHEMLTGRRLFRRLGENDDKTLDRILRAEVPAPSSLRVGLPRALDQICARALAREPSDRYDSADEMAADLDNVLLDLRFGSTQLAELLRASVPQNLQPVLLTDEPRTDAQGSQDSKARPTVTMRPVSLDDEVPTTRERGRAVNEKEPRRERSSPSDEERGAPPLSPAVTTALSPAATVQLAPGATIRYDAGAMTRASDAGATVVRARRQLGRRLIAAAVVLGGAAAFVFGLFSASRNVQSPASAQATTKTTEQPSGARPTAAAMKQTRSAPEPREPREPSPPEARADFKEPPPLEAKTRRHSQRKKAAAGATSMPTPIAPPSGAANETQVQVERGDLADPFIGGGVKKK